MMYKLEEIVCAVSSCCLRDFMLRFVVFNGLKTNKNGSEIFSAYPTSKGTIRLLNTEGFLLDFVPIFPINWL